MILFLVFPLIPSFPLLTLETCLIAQWNQEVRLLEILHWHAIFLFSTKLSIVLKIVWISSFLWDNIRWWGMSVFLFLPGMAIVFALRGPPSWATIPQFSWTKYIGPTLLIFVICLPLYVFVFATHRLNDFFSPFLL